MTIGSGSIPMWSISGRRTALDKRNRPLPQPMSSTRGASRPNSSTKSMVPAAGKRLTAVLAHCSAGKIWPANGTPNSNSMFPSMVVACGLPVPSEPCERAERCGRLAERSREPGRRPARDLGLDCDRGLSSAALRFGGSSGGCGEESVEFTWFLWLQDWTGPGGTPLPHPHSADCRGECVRRRLPSIDEQPFPAHRVPRNWVE